MEKLSKILHNLDQGNINVETAKDQVLDVTEAGKWTKERPRLGVTHRENFILLTASKEFKKTYGWYEGRWDYDVFTIIYDDGCWQWRDINGNEIGDINDIVADYYMTIPELKMQ